MPPPRWRTPPETRARVSLDAVARLIAVVGSRSGSILSEGVEEVISAVRPVAALAWAIGDEGLSLRVEHQVSVGALPTLRALSLDAPVAAPLLAAVRSRRAQSTRLRTPGGLVAFQSWLPLLTRDMGTVVIVPAVSGASVLAIAALFLADDADEIDNEVERFLQMSAPLLGLGISSQLERETETRRAAELAETSRLAALGTVAVTVAHELRGPSGALALLVPEVNQVVTAMLEGEAPRADVVEGLLGDMRACVDQITRLCGQLRGLGYQDPTPESFELDDLAADVLAIARVHSKEVGVTIDEEVTPGLSLVGRRDQISQVVLNLLLNAVDACAGGPPAGRHVHLTANAVDGAAVVEVADSGPGVDAKDVDRIFEPFFTTKPRGKGIGLGLSVSRDIVHAHRGHIEVGTSPAGGALFRVVLPRVETTSRARLIASPVGAPAGRDENLVATVRPAVGPKQRLRVLIVDDDPLLLRTMKRVLGGHEVALAASVDEARSRYDEHLARGEPIDVVVSDINMPEGGGVAFHRWLNTVHLRVAPRLVFLSGGALSPTDADYVRNAGCVCLPKPVAPDVLTDAVVGAPRQGGAARGSLTLRPVR